MEKRNTPRVTFINSDDESDCSSNIAITGSARVTFTEENNNLTTDNNGILKPAKKRIGKKSVDFYLRPGITFVALTLFGLNLFHSFLIDSFGIDVFFTLIALGAGLLLLKLGQRCNRLELWSIAAVSFLLLLGMFSHSYFLVQMSFAIFAIGIFLEIALAGYLVNTQCDDDNSGFLVDKMAVGEGWVTFVLAVNALLIAIFMFIDALNAAGVVYETTLTHLSLNIVVIILTSVMAISFLFGESNSDDAVLDTLYRESFFPTYLPGRTLLQNIKEAKVDFKQWTIPIFLKKSVANDEDNENECGWSEEQLRQS